MNSKEDVVYRPDAEANSLILEIIKGNITKNCTSSLAPTNIKNRERKLEDIYDEIEVLSSLYPDTNKIFLSDKDALNLDTIHLAKILIHLSKFFFNLKRVSIYASSLSLKKKSIKELLILRRFKLSLFYYSLDSADELVLKSLGKNINENTISDDLNKLSECKIKIALTVILGLGGKTRSIEHIKNSALLLNKLNINYLFTQTLEIKEGKNISFVKAYKENIGDFIFLNQVEMLKEQMFLISLLKPSNLMIFRSLHKCNALCFIGVLPKDKNKLVSEIKDILIKCDLKFISKSFG